MLIPPLGTEKQPQMVCVRRHFRNKHLHAFCKPLLIYAPAARQRIRLGPFVHAVDGNINSTEKKVTTIVECVQ